jgi:predicted O-methyltransferase YrrM
MSADPFGEEWFSDASQRAVADLARSVADVPGLMVEVGSWTGRSTCALAKAINPRPLHAVDTWAGSPGEISSTLAAERDVFAQWQRNVDEFTDGNVIAHRVGWREFFADKTSPLAFVFIDAEHTEVEVADNIAAVLPWLAEGGIICGDDVMHPPVRQGIARHLRPVDVQVEIGTSVWWWKR